MDTKKTGELQKEIEEIGTLTDIVECLSTTIRQYNYYFQTKLGTVSPHWKKSNPNYYCFIPSAHSSEVAERLIYAKQYLQNQRRSRKQLKLLDCGCGIGNILAIASCIGLAATGIEYELATYRLGKDIFTSENREHTNCGAPINIIKGDILFFRHYGDYDIIYYFTPIMNTRMREKFVKKLARDIKIGTLVISYTNGGDSLWQSRRFEKLTKGEEIFCYEKIK